MPCRTLLSRPARALPLKGLLLVCALCGCGTTQNRSGTEQLVSSDAVDRSIARIDFSHLAGQKVFLDTDYLKNAKPVGWVTSEYVISSFRQQILASGCLLQEEKAKADFIIEGRIGALGLDGHDVVYGLPANNALNAASSLVPTTAPIPLPTIPELALAKRNDQMGAAKVGAFAYNRVTREVVWQSGISQSRSTSRDLWLAGIGPFQSGSILNDPNLARGKFSPIGLRRRPNEPEVSEFSSARTFGPAVALPEGEVLPGQPAEANPVANPAPGAKPPGASPSPPVAAPPPTGGAIQQAAASGDAPASEPTATQGAPAGSGAPPANESAPAVAEVPPATPAPFPEGGPEPRSIPPRASPLALPDPTGSRPYTPQELERMFGPK